MGEAVEVSCVEKQSAEHAFFHEKTEKKEEKIGYTPEQEKIIFTDLGPDEIAVINAYAGSGKTTTALGWIKAFTTRPPQTRKKPLYLTFNKKMIEVVGQKIARAGGEAKTTHSLAYSFCKSVNPGCALVSGLQDVKGVTREQYNLISSFCDSTQKEFTGSGPVFKKAKEAYEKMTITNELPMPYDVYLKYFILHPESSSWIARHYGAVIIDEAQDTNAAFTDFCLNRLCGKGVSLVFLGDYNQSIYGFRSCVDAMRLAIEMHPLRAKQYTLTESFRFDAGYGERVMHFLEAVKGQLLKRECGVLKGAARGRQTHLFPLFAREKLDLGEKNPAMQDFYPYVAHMDRVDHVPHPNYLVVTETLSEMDERHALKTKPFCRAFPVPPGKTFLEFCQEGSLTFFRESDKKKNITVREMPFFVPNVLERQRTFVSTEEKEEMEENENEKIGWDVSFLNKEDQEDSDETVDGETCLFNFIDPDLLPSALLPQEKEKENEKKKEKRERYDRGVCSNRYTVEMLICGLVKYDKQHQYKKQRLLDEENEKQNQKKEEKEKEKKEDKREPVYHVGVIARKNETIFLLAKALLDVGNISFSLAGNSTSKFVAEMEKTITEYGRMRKADLQDEIKRAKDDEDFETTRLLKMVAKLGAPKVKQMLEKMKDMAEQAGPNPSVMIGTCHSHKGLEFETIVIMDDFYKVHRIANAFHDDCRFQHSRYSQDPPFFSSFSSFSSISSFTNSLDDEKEGKKEKEEKKNSFSEDSYDSFVSALAPNEGKTKKPEKEKDEKEETTKRHIKKLLLPRAIAKTRAELEEETNLLYVAMTRGMSNVFVCSPDLYVLMAKGLENARLLYEDAPKHEYFYRVCEKLETMHKSMVDVFYLENDNLANNTVPLFLQKQQQHQSKPSTGALDSFFHATVARTTRRTRELLAVNDPFKRKRDDDDEKWKKNFVTTKKQRFVENEEEKDIEKNNEKEKVISFDRFACPAPQPSQKKYSLNPI